METVDVNNYALFYGYGCRCDRKGDDIRLFAISFPEGTYIDNHSTETVRWLKQYDDGANGTISLCLLNDILSLTMSCGKNEQSGIIYMEHHGGDCGGTIFVRNRVPRDVLVLLISLAKNTSEWKPFEVSKKEYREKFFES